MNAIVSKWGNSLALRIPNGIARALDLREQTSVLFDVRDGALIVRPVEKKKFDLDTLLSGITAENIHAETSTGPSVGNESHGSLAFPAGRSSWCSGRQGYRCASENEPSCG